MHAPATLLICALCATPPTAHAATGSLSAEFAVRATVDSFTGRAQSDAFAVADSPEGQVLAIAVPVANLQTGKAKRDAEMRHMFHAEIHPEIVGTVRLADLQALAAEEGVTNALPFALAISGVTNRLEASVSGVKREGERLSLDAQFPVLLKAFGLKPPSVIGLIRVNNEVKVKAHVEWTP